MWVPLVGPTPFSFLFLFFLPFPPPFPLSFLSLPSLSFLFLAFFACSCREERPSGRGAGRRTAQRGARGQDGGVRPRRRGRRAWRGTQEAAGQPVGWHGRQPGATRARQCTAGRRHCSSRGHDPRRRATGAAAASAGAAPAEAASGQEGRAPVVRGGVGILGQCRPRRLGARQGRPWLGPGDVGQGDAHRGMEEAGAA